MNKPSSHAYQYGNRRFEGVNWLGFWTLYLREVRRFTSVYTQTILAPLATAVLFMAVFAFAFSNQRAAVDGIPFVMFMAPGIVMMSVIQNAFANTSSSILISKVQGNIVDTLMPPLSPLELTAGFALGGATRGVIVAITTSLLLFSFIGLNIIHPFWAIFFVVNAGLLLAMIGMAAGIWSEKFDHMAAVTNFVITPLSFLSGTFYSINVLPDPWVTLSLYNPFFYIIDGFRFSVLGQSDADPITGTIVLISMNIILGFFCWFMFKRGYNLKS